MEIIHCFYDGTQTEAIASLQADAYYFNNPFVKPLGITRDELQKEFYDALISNKYRWTFLFFEKQAFLKGEREIVGCFSWSDAVDYIPPRDQDFNQVPNKFDVRTYMKHLCLEYFYKKYSPKEGQMAFGTTFGVNPKYMGQNIGYKMFQQTVEWLIEHGYQSGVGNCINEISKQVFRKAHILEMYTVDVSNMTILSDNSQPFKGLQLCQEVYVIEAKPTVRMIKQLIHSKERKNARL